MRDFIHVHFIADDKVQGNPWRYIRSLDSNSGRKTELSELNASRWLLDTKTSPFWKHTRTRLKCDCK